ncbi:putative ketopantoate reductase ApbA/PanE, 6-phosphogluconate dehydrogenase-like domain superfamily [Plasmopara halstedii]
MGRMKIAIMLRKWSWRKPRGDLTFRRFKYSKSHVQDDDVAMSSSRLRVGVLGLGAIGTIFFTRLGLLATNLKGTTKFPKLTVDAFIRPKRFENWVQSQTFQLNILQGQKKETLHFCIAPSNKLATVWNAPHVRIRTLTSHDNQTSDKVDVLLVAVKAYDSTNVVQELWETKRHMLQNDAICILLQNGLGHEVPENSKNLEMSWQFLNGVTFIGGRMINFGSVETSGLETGMTFLAPMTQVHCHDIETCKRMKRINVVAQIFQAAGLRCEVLETSAMQGMQWRKLIINAAINPLASLLNAPNSSVISSQSSRDCIKMVVEEAIAVAQSEKIVLGCSQDELLHEVVEVANNTGTNICSMLADLRRGSRTEIDAITGRLVQGGERYGIATPVNRFLLLLIQALEKEGLRRNDSTTSYGSERFNSLIMQRVAVLVCSEPIMQSCHIVSSLMYFWFYCPLCLLASAKALSKLSLEFLMDTFILTISRFPKFGTTIIILLF